MAADASLGSGQYKDLAALPDIYDSYNEKLLWFKRNKKPRECVDYIIYYIVSSALTLLTAAKSGGAGPTSAILSAFVSYMIEKILTRDRLSTVAGEFNWNIFAKKGETYKEKEVYNENVDEDAGLADKAAMKEEGMVSTADPFKNKFDVDNAFNSADGEGADLEDNAIAEFGNEV
jgi:hypothetical protein